MPVPDLPVGPDDFGGQDTPHAPAAATLAAATQAGGTVSVDVARQRLGLRDAVSQSAPTVGRIVHYTCPGSWPGEPGPTYAALVTGVDEVNVAICHLTVFPPDERLPWHRRARCDPQGGPDTWRWPERS